MKIETVIYPDGRVLLFSPLSHHLTVRVIGGAVTARGSREYVRAFWQMLAALA